MSLQLDDSSGLQFAKNYSPRELWLLVETFHLVDMKFLSPHGHGTRHLSPQRVSKPRFAITAEILVHSWVNFHFQQAERHIS